MNLEDLRKITIVIIFVIFPYTINAEDTQKVILSTNWLAQAEHGGFYQALAEGIYKKYNLDVEIRQGGPGINTKALLVAGKVDFNIGGSAGALNFVNGEVPFKAVAAIFQKDPQVLISHPNQGNDKIENFKGKKILISKYNQVTFWPFLKAKYGFTDDQIKPYNFSLQPFLEDKTSIQQGYLTSEPYSILSKAGFQPVVNLLADNGYMPYATTIETSIEKIQNNPKLIQNFVDASIEGWYSYIYGNPELGNQLIKKDNPEMSNDLLNYARDEMKKRGIVFSGDTEKMGIGAMTDSRWKSFFELMRDQGLYPETLDYKKAYTLNFVNNDKWIGYENKY
ncbi:MAG: hypothetical protein CFH22_00213 [Alphaproteobacteria bacterium MarineAlpha5_Bin12]|nr:nitrate ABC transporter substrate-binding protein [Pelagibacteraceae bacterium]PPR42139.1 MAG: hypothetical protein CFH22_00213 [Alphaproteobacteria bacterium MarineAlpha5_Bin12]|tara:strand:- start:5198 stop:6208 length:1011 start_codon:yes stop_codon:yes gene_type:complete